MKPSAVIFPIPRGGSAGSLLGLRRREVVSFMSVKKRDDPLAFIANRRSVSNQAIQSVDAAQELEVGR
jgi:hypothetical protein